MLKTEIKIRIYENPVVAMASADEAKAWTENRVKNYEN